jgi:hypothetical protein
MSMFLAWRRPHPVAIAIVLAILGLFTWMNVGFSRHAYVERHMNGFRGGLRQGYPFTWWDAGCLSQSTATPTGLELTIVPYGGYEWGGVACNVGMLLLACGFAVALSRKLFGERALPLTEADKPRRIGLITGVLATMTMASLGWLNLQVDTIMKTDDAGMAKYEQRMGWPLVVYSAKNPKVVSMENEEPVANPVATLAWLRSNPRAWYQFTHWHEGHIVINVLVCMLLVVCAACCCEWHRRARIGRRI